MAHYGTLRDFRFSNDVDDIRGATLYGSKDEKLGKIDDVIFDHESGGIKYVIVDTGGWLHSRHFMIPADRIEMRGDKDDEYRVNISKQQIETFPAYDESHLRDEKRWRDYEEKYRKASGWTEAGVLHQQDTTRIITPDPETVSPNAPHIRAGDHVEGLEPSQLPRQAAGPMNTSATAWGQTPENTRLQETEVTSPREGSNQIVSDYAATSRFDNERKREDQPDFSAGNVPRTIEGDALLNEEDVHHLHRRHEHTADLDRSSRIEGGGEVGSGSYLGAHVGRRWSRFENRLREERGRITSNCTVCDLLRNRHREDVA
jgi:sporulation protein YlmC with PRC-barrel domain